MPDRQDLSKLTAFQTANFVLSLKWPSHRRCTGYSDLDVPVCASLPKCPKRGMFDLNLIYRILCEHERTVIISIYFF